MILTIAGRELRSLFLSPLAWSVLAVVQLILAYVFLIQVELFLQWQPRLAAMEGAPGATDIIVAPLFRTAAIVLVLLGLTVLMPLSLLAGGGLDWGLLASGAIGLALVVAAFAAAGLFLSTLTDQPTVAGVSTFGLLLLLWILDWAGGTGNEAATEAFTYLSLLTHYDALLKGVFDSQDVIYYVLFSATFLVLGIRRLDAERLQE